MNVSSVLNELAVRGIQLQADGEQLVIRAPKGALTSELQTHLRTHKRELLSLIRQQDEHARGDSLDVTSHPDARYLPFPLTDMQHAYWVGRSSAFEMGQVACQLYFESESRDLDLPRLAAAWRRLIERHDLLRAVVRPDATMQVLREVPEFSIPVTDLSDHAPGDAERELAQLREAMSHRVAPTDRWPLYEMCASLLADGRTRLHVRIEVLIADGRSIFNLLREWGELYREPTRQLPPLTLLFRDYAVAEQAHRDTEAYRRSERYWRDRLAELPPAPDLPLAARRPSGAPQRFVRRTFTLDAVRWARLSERGRTGGLTRSSLTCAVYAEILRGFSKSPDFSINVTVLNRPRVHPQIDDVVGDFTITLLLAARGTGASFAERAADLHRQLASDLEHAGYSAVRVLRELARQRGSKRAALMPIIFTSPLGARIEDAEVTSFLGELRYCITQTPQLWLDHQVSERDGELVVTWDAIDANFAPGLLDDMFAAYGDLLHRLADDDDAAWHAPRRRCLPEAHRHARAQVNATAGELTPRLLHEPFLAHAAAQPTAPAVICSERTLSYGELARLSGHLARRLRAAGAQPNRLVAVVMDKGWEQVVAVLAILQAGAGYLPVDPALPTERFHHLLAHGEVALVVTQPRLLDALAWPSGVDVLAVDLAALAGEDLGPLPPAQSWDDLAYVIYTSGSTGLPKGVMIDHRGALNTIVDLNQRFAIGPADRVLGLSALNFDLSVYDIFGTLAAGAALVLPDAGTTREPAHWAELIARERVTLWSSVPALMQMLVEYLEGLGQPIADSLRRAWLSGDWIPVDLPHRVRALQPAVELISMGGATEASIWSILYPIGEVDPAWTSIPYGKPMRNQTFHVVDDRLEDCPVWVPGQLVIGGTGVALGYWRDPERTREAFFVDDATGERRYRTGDLGRYLPDGNLEFLGREDSQVKIRGHRIELGEIETALRGHPGVRSAVAAAIGRDRSSLRLIAYVVREPASLAADGAPQVEGGAQVTEAVGVADLRALVAAKLPEHMVPATVMFVDELPVSANGKIDRNALPVPDLHGEHAADIVAPRTPLEQVIADAWAGVLGVARIGVRDTFFDLGGDSVMMITAHRRLRDVLQRELTVVELFQYPTVESLAKHLSAPALQADAAAERQDRAHRRSQAADDRRAARARRGAASAPNSVDRLGEGES